MKTAVDHEKLHQLYQRYKDPHDESKIGIDGIQQFCDDLLLDPVSVSVLIVAWKFRAATQCEFSREEFLDGMLQLGCDSPEKLRSLLPRLQQELKDSGKFRDFYQFTFSFARSPGQKGLGFLGSLCTALFASYTIQGKPLVSWGRDLMMVIPKAEEYCRKTIRHMAGESSATGLISGCLYGLLFRTDQDLDKRQKLEDLGEGLHRAAAGEK